MKFKYILIGICSTILFFTLALTVGYLYIKNERLKMLTNENTKEIVSLQYEIFDASNINLAQLQITNLSNQSIDSLSNNRLKFINFWATWCMPCISELKSIEELQNKNSDIDFLLLSEENIDQIKKFKNKNNYTLSFYNYIKLKNDKVFNHQIIPATYIIDMENKIGYKILGSCNYNSKLFNNFINSIKP